MNFFVPQWQPIGKVSCSSAEADRRLTRYACGHISPIPVGDREHYYIKAEKYQMPPLICDFWRLEKSLQKNPAQYFLNICVGQIKKMGAEYLEIINPRENIWLMEHNLDRPLDSILKSGINMYTRVGLNINGELQLNWRVRITF